MKTILRIAFVMGILPLLAAVGPVAVLSHHTPTGCPGTAPSAADAFWPLGGNPTGTYSSSTTVPDDSGSGYTAFWQGTNSGSPHYWYTGTGCPVSSAICGTFDGTDNIIDNYSTAPHPTTKVSIFARFKTSGPGSGASGFMAIVRKEGAFTIGLTNGSSCNALFGVFVGSNATGSTNYCDGNPHDFLATFDNSLGSNNMVIYIDGSSVATANNTNTIPSAPDYQMAIGGSVVYGDQLFNGILQRVAMWDSSALTAANDTYLHSCSSSPY